MVTIKFSNEELGFVEEALSDKFESLMKKIDDAKEESIPAFKNYLEKVAAHFEEDEAPKKKPHWTHTARGKKILAARKRTKK
jgi:hypothetical protein